MKPTLTTIFKLRAGTIFFALVAFVASAQTKKTGSQLKALSITTTTARTVYYVVSGSDTTYYKWQYGYYPEGTLGLIFTKANYGAFVPFVPLIQPQVLPVEKKVDVGPILTNYPVFKADNKTFNIVEDLPFAFDGKDTARDEGVYVSGTSWEVYLRVVDQDSGRAIFFEGSGQTIYSVGVIQGLFTKQKLKTTYWHREKENLVIPPKGDSLYLEVSGFDITASVDGKPYITLKEFDHLYAGTVKAKTNVREQSLDLTIVYKPRKALYSNTDERIFDGRDLDIKEAQTTGSIDSGSNVIRIAKGTARLYELGQTLITEAGHTKDFYGRKSGDMGTKDGDGSSPSEWIDGYQKLTGIIRPNGYHIADYKTGIRYYTNGKGEWAAMDANGNGSNTGFYQYMATGLAYRPIIIKIDYANDLLYCDHKSKATITDAPITLDISWAWNRLLSDPRYNLFFGYYPTVRDDSKPAYLNWRNLSAIILPFTLKIEGSPTSSERLYVINRRGVNIISDDLCIIKSPKGTSNAVCYMNGVNDCAVKNVYLQGNVLDSSFTPVVYGFNYGSGTPETGEVLRDIPTYFNEVNGTWASGWIVGDGNNIRFDNVYMLDGFTGGISTQNLTNSLFTNVGYKRRFPLRTYGGWPLGFNSNSHGCVMDGFEVDAPTIQGGFEAFNSDNCTFRNGKLRNATGAANSSRNYLIEKIAIHIEQGAAGKYRNENPGINLNQNARQGETKGGTVNDISITVDGPLDNDALAMVGIAVQADNDDISISNIRYKLGDGFIGKTIQRGRAVVSDGKNTTVDRVICDFPKDYDFKKYGWTLTAVGIGATGTLTNSVFPSASYHRGQATLENNKGAVYVFEDGGGVSLE